MQQMLQMSFKVSYFSMGVFELVQTYVHSFGLAESVLWILLRVEKHMELGGTDGDNYPSYFSLTLYFICTFFRKWGAEQ